MTRLGREEPSTRTSVRLREKPRTKRLRPSRRMARTDEKERDDRHFGLLEICSADMNRI